MDKIPCVHAIAVAETCKISRITLCHSYYHNNNLAYAYNMSVMPRDDALPIPDEVAMKVCKPPRVDDRQRAGRPKKSRIKAAMEIAMSKKRQRKEHLCSKCNQGGHNSRTCVAKS